MVRNLQYFNKKLSDENIKNNRFISNYIFEL